MRLPSHEDHSRHRRTELVSKGLIEGLSVHLRHPQVAHDQVIPYLLASAKGLGSARRRLDLMAEIGEDVDDQGANKVFIIDNQDMGSPGGNHVPREVYGRRALTSPP